MTTLQAWLRAFRLRTLPLALSSIVMGAYLAARDNRFLWSVFLLTILTTLFLQVLSNLANDYGDFVKGTDNDARVGPVRALQSGLITEKQMKNGILVCSLLAFTSGVLLLYVAGAFSDFRILFVFLGTGLVSILAAITYTIGKNAYGYKGLGDISVLFFFGVVGVLGTHFLMTGDFRPVYLFPAVSCGLLATGVLNLNNLRDIENDRASGKKSIPVKIGFKAGKMYHTCLVLGSLTFLACFLLLEAKSYQEYLPLLLLPVYVIHVLKVNNTMVHKSLDPFLKQLALLSLSTSVLLVLSQFL